MRLGSGDTAIEAEARRVSTSTRWIAWLFMIGAALFAAASIPALAEVVPADVIGVAYFVGSIYFTSASLLVLVTTTRSMMASQSPRPRLAIHRSQPRRFGALHGCGNPRVHAAVHAGPAGCHTRQYRHDAGCALLPLGCSAPARYPEGRRNFRRADAQLTFTPSSGGFASCCDQRPPPGWSRDQDEVRCVRQALPSQGRSRR